MLAQAQKYAALRKPYLINDMQLQDLLLDRRRVYETLQVRLQASVAHADVLAFLMHASNNQSCAKRGSQCCSHLAAQNG